MTADGTPDPEPLERLLQPHLKRRLACGRLFELQEGWRNARAITACKEEVLACLLDLPGPLWLRYAEDPADDGLPGRWERVGDQWRVPKDVPAAAIWEWLHLGNWALYASERPIADLPCLDDAFADGVVVPAPTHWIDAFHDNDPWSVLLR